MLLSTTANEVSLWGLAVLAFMMCLTGMPRAASASAIMERWQRHGTASAHMIATRRFARSRFRASTPRAKSGVAI